MDRVFDRDVDAYLTLLPGLLTEQRGRFVVIQDTKAREVFDTRAAALEFAYHEYQRAPFIVKQILESDLQSGKAVPEACRS